MSMSVVALCVFAQCQAAPNNTKAADSLARTPGLRVVISGEQPTGIYHDSAILLTQTQLIFTINVFNDLPQSRRVALLWKVVDGAGRIVVQQRSGYDVAGRGLLRRKVLYEARDRGSFLLHADATSKRDGPDDREQADMPFAVIATPSAGYRPHSFFALDTPALLSPAALDFYERAGARVLRSTWTSGKNDTGSLDDQLRARLQRQLATLAVVPMGNKQDPAAGIRLPILIDRYREVAGWELDGMPLPADLSAVARTTRALNPSPLLVGRVPLDLLPVQADGRSALKSLDGLSMPLWTDEEARANPNARHPSGGYRSLLSRRSIAGSSGVNSIYVRGGADGSGDDPVAAAGTLVSDYVLAIMSGAGGMSSTLQSPAERGVGAPSSQTALSRAAAFAAMNSFLEDTAYHSNALPAVPQVWGAIFRGAATTVAVLWTARAADSGTISFRLRDARNRLYDVYGNPAVIAGGDRLTVPLSSVPVYLVTTATPAALSSALQAGNVTGMRPLAVQVMPLTARPRSPVAPGTVTPKQTLRVRLQNIVPQSVAGVVQLTPPAGWKLENDTAQFQLNSGATRIYTFVAQNATASPQGIYPVSVGARTSQGRWQWDQTLRIAAAGNVQRGHPLTVDGSLDEWRDVAWMELSSGAKPQVSGRVALRWDARNLYVAARVTEPSLQPRRPELGQYPFWDGYDALQLAFGTRENPTPQAGPFRDSDFGILLSPFASRQTGIEGRVLWLWNPRMPFGESADHVRWGGSVTGSNCMIRRRESSGETVYEASLPLSEVPGLNPVERSGGTPVRFSWVLHDDQGEALQWSRAASVFPWWNNTGSFLPPQRLYLAVQTLLGFERQGSVDPGIPRPAPSTSLPPKRDSPNRRRVLPKRPAPNPTPEPPQLLPLPPSALPPVTPPSDNSLPPSMPQQ